MYFIKNNNNNFNIALKNKSPLIVSSVGTATNPNLCDKYKKEEENVLKVWIYIDMFRI
jgi:hypothetical protein